MKPITKRRGIPLDFRKIIKICRSKSRSHFSLETHGDKWSNKCPFPFLILETKEMQSACWKSSVIVWEIAPSKRTNGARCPRKKVKILTFSSCFDGAFDTGFKKKSLENRFFIFSDFRTECKSNPGTGVTVLDHPPCCLLSLHFILRRAFQSIQCNSTHKSFGSRGLCTAFSWVLVNSSFEHCTWRMQRGLS